MTDLVFLTCTLILSVSCTVYFLMSKRLQKVQSVLLLIIMINISLSAVTDIISNYIENTTIARGGIFALQYGTQMAFFIFHITLAPLYALYVMMVNGIGLNKRVRDFIPILIPMIVAEVLIIINPFTNWMFYYNGNKNFVRGPYEFIIYGVAAFYLVLALYFMVKYRTAVTKTTNFTLWYFFSFTLVGILIQLVNSEFKVELFAESVSLLGIILSIENDAEFIDYATKVYNRRAFMNEIIRLLRTGHRYGVISITLTNLRFYQRMLNYNATSEMLSMISDWLSSTDKRVNVYRTTPDSFAVIYLYERETDMDMLVDIIAEQFTSGWVFDGVHLDFNTVIHAALIPQEIADPDLILELTEQNSDVEHSGVVVMKGKDLEAITRKTLIEHALRRAIDEDEFKVYYQPIWNAKTKKIETAEALVRLIDPALGFIPPDEFIQIAEQNGLINDIGISVFEKVCAFLADERTKKVGLTYVEVNLSIYQLIAGNTIEQFKEAMDKYGVTPDQINLEITESGSVSTSHALLTNIDELKELGFKFSLDDYGTGYSNLTYIISMDFTNIKSDKGLLWDANKNENSRILLTDTIQMMRRLGFNVIQEGVENREQLDLVVNAGANLIQGYYFSKPVPAGEFLTFVERFDYSKYA